MFITQETAYTHTKTRKQVVIRKAEKNNNIRVPRM